jgi:predicted MFS family arabinose efflux permease
MLHGCMQVFSTELSEGARATSLSVHSSCFFFGQTAGPIAYGFGLDRVGKLPTLAIAAGVIMLLGLAGARLLAKPEVRRPTSQPRPR